MNTRKATGINGYSIISAIGKGAFATVYLAIEQVTNRYCAVKRISRSIGDEMIARVKREVDLMYQIRNPFIVFLFDSFEDENSIYIVMEFCQNGSLKDWLLREGALGEEIGLVLLLELAQALSYLHRRNILHRDLKAENILFDGASHVKLCDFGLSTILESDKPEVRTACGSPAYASPEMITRAAYSSKCDVWSLGICFYTMLTGSLPFKGADIQGCMRAILCDELQIPANVSEGCADLLRLMLEKDPDKRPDIFGVLNHPLLTKHRLYKNVQMIGAWHETEKDEEQAVGHVRNDMRLIEAKARLLGNRSNGYTPSGKVNPGIPMERRMGSHIPEVKSLREVRRHPGTVPRAIVPSHSFRQTIGLSAKGLIAPMGGVSVRRRTVAQTAWFVKSRSCDEQL